MHSFRFLIPFISLWACTVTGQELDSIKSLLHAAHALPASKERDSILAYHFDYLAEAYSGNRDSLAQLYIDSLQQLSGQHTWSKAEGLLERAKGKFHDRRGEFDEALEHYTLAIEAFKKTADQSDLIAYTYILKAFVLNNNGLVEDCEKTLTEIRPLAEQLPNKNFLAWIIDWYGDTYFYSSFGHQDIKKALGYYLQVEALLPRVKNKMIHADNAHCLAGCYLRLGEEEKAAMYRRQALDIAGKHGLHSVIFAVYGDLADVYEERGDFEEAIDNRLLSLDYARKTHWIEMEGRAERNAAYTYKAAGDFENALIHFEKEKAIEDSLARYAVQQKYHELELKYASGRKDLEIQQLHSAKLRLYLYIAIGLLTGGMLFLYYYRRTNKKLLEHNAALEQKNREIRMALTEGQNLERKRMAIELHDNINAKIAAAKWVLETINSPDKSEEEQKVIDQLVDTMSDIYEDVRFISHNLVPKELETKSLSEIMRQLVHNLNQNQKIRFAFRMEGEEPVLESGIKLQCYAMIMELINNAIRHAECTEAWVDLACQPGELRICVRDNGKGLDEKNARDGAGLKNLHTRVSAIRGHIRFSVPAEGGTLIDIRIPIDR